jgi:hypothetical protein
MTPALFAANEAERTAPGTRHPAPGTTLVDVQMIGATGRIYTSRSRKTRRDGPRPDHQRSEVDRGAEH